jgi:hypothetical protein
LFTTIVNKMNDEELSEKSSARSSLADDVEAQPILKSVTTNEPAPLATEYRTNLSTKLVYLGGYFLLNLSLTLYNKAILNTVSFCRKDCITHAKGARH